MHSLFTSLLAEPSWLDFLHELEAYLCGIHATLVLRRPRQGDPGILISTQSKTAALSVLQSRIFRESPILDLPYDKVCILSELVSHQQLKSLHAPYYAYMQEYGKISDIIGVNLYELDTGMVFRFRCARQSGQRNFGPPERAKVEALLPWIRTAIGLYARQARREYQLNVSEATLKQVTIGSLVVDEREQVVITNPLANQVLEHNDGLMLRQGKFHCSTPEDQSRLQSALNQLRGRSGFDDYETLQIGRPRGGRWHLLLRPINAMPGIDELAANLILVMFRDGGSSGEISKELLMELFGLTRAESALMCRLVLGESLTEAAENLGRSRYTTRAQLSSIFAKTGIHRQPQLVSHILNIVNELWEK